MNENIGDIDCPHHDRRVVARVRKNRKGKLYYFCADCGIIQGTGPTFLAWVAEHARMYGPDGEPEQVAEPETVVETEPEPVEVKPKPARRYTGPGLV